MAGAARSVSRQETMTARPYTPDMRWRNQTSGPNDEFARITEDLWQKAEAVGVPPERFVEVVMQGLDQSVPPLVNRLLHDAPKMIEIGTMSRDMTKCPREESNLRLAV
jgi:hypothetical protein